MVVCLATTCHSSSPLFHSSLIVGIDHRCYLLYSLLVVQPLLLHRFSDFQQHQKISFHIRRSCSHTPSRPTQHTHTTTSNNVNFFIELTPQKTCHNHHHHVKEVPFCIKLILQPLQLVNVYQPRNDVYDGMCVSMRRHCFGWVAFCFCFLPFLSQ